MRRSALGSVAMIVVGLAAFAAGIWMALSMSSTDRPDASGIVIIATQSAADEPDPTIEGQVVPPEQAPSHEVAEQRLQPAPEPQPVQNSVVPYPRQLDDDDAVDDEWDDD